VRVNGGNLQTLYNVANKCLKMLLLRELIKYALKYTPLFSNESLASYKKSTSESRTAEREA